MPILLRVAHVGDVPPGTSLVSKIRGRSVRILNLGGTFYAFDAESAPMGREVTEADLVWARQKHAPEFRAVLRGTFVHIGMDPDRQQAPASVQSIVRPAQPVP
jgi:hypothetical protein